MTLLFQQEEISHVAAHGCRFVYKTRRESITMRTSYSSIFYLQLLFLKRYLTKNPDVGVPNPQLVHQCQWRNQINFLYVNPLVILWDFWQKIFNNIHKYSEQFSKKLG